MSLLRRCLSSSHLHSTAFTIANEGLVDTVKGFFHNSRKKDREFIEKSESLDFEGFARLVHDTIGNKDWLDQVRIVDGKIPGKGIVEFLSIEKKFDTHHVRNIQEIGKFIKHAASDLTPKYKVFGDELRKILESLNKPGGDLKARWSEACSKAKKLKHPKDDAKEYLHEVEKLMGGFVVKGFSDDDQWLTHEALNTKPEELDPLNKEEILEISNALVELLKSIASSQSKKYATVLYDAARARNVPALKDGYLEHPSQEDYEQAYGKGFYGTVLFELDAEVHQYRDPIFVLRKGTMEIVECVIKAYAKWINSSIK